MKPETERLLDDLMSADGQRQATLLEVTAILRRRRRWRVARQSLALLVLAALASLLVVRDHHPRTLAQISRPVEPAGRSKPQAQELTDAQLLSLFPDTPVGLATLSNGKKLLLFPARLTRSNM